MEGFAQNCSRRLEWVTFTMHTYFENDVRLDYTSVSSLGCSFVFFGRVIISNCFQDSLNLCSLRFSVMILVPRLRLVLRGLVIEAGAEHILSTGGGR